jgi:hypothetical protein
MSEGRAQTFSGGGGGPQAYRTCRYESMGKEFAHFGFLYMAL